LPNRYAVRERINFESRIIARCAIAMAALIPFHLAFAQQQSDNTVYKCEKITNARIGQAGVTYTGTINNSDYRFKVNIPKGLIGLGAAPGAPFHGFTIFIDETTCIAFGIEQRVLLPEDTPNETEQPIKLPIVKVGNRKGLEESIIGNAQGVPYLNITVWVELPRSGYTNVVDIRLVTLIDKRSIYEPIFRSFLSSFRFY
jgi:hypothetical protein